MRKVVNVLTGEETFEEAAPPPPPEILAAMEAAERANRTLTFPQLLIGLVSEGWITEADGEAWLVGTLPAPVSALIGTLPTNQRFAARARAVQPSVVVRNDPLVNALGLSQGKTAEELDAFFLTYAQA